MTHKILAYHRISSEPAPGLEEWAIQPSAFRRQMELLHRLGYRGVSTRELLDSIEKRDGEKLIGLTFDDGYADTVETALPVLSVLGFTATVYVVPSEIGGATNWEGVDSASPLASWTQLSQLVDAGWEIGMHSYSHPPRLDLLSGPELRKEVAEGVDELRTHLQTTVDSFAYPHGHHSNSAVEAIRAAGYRNAVTTIPGAVTSLSDPYRLPRFELKRRDSLLEFACMLMTNFLPRRRATLQRFSPSRLRQFATREHVGV